MEEKIVTERRGHVLRMGLNRPDKYNAFDTDMYHGLARAYAELERDPELRCGLLYAAGDNFTSGLDLPKWAPAFGQGRMPELPEDELDPFGLQPDRRLSKPIVVAIQGLCYTVGVELSLAADIRVCSSEARFGQIEVRRGIYAVGGATFRMVQQFGWGNAQKLLLTGGDFDAAEAHRIGLVQEVVEPGKAFERGLALAEEVAAQAPLAVQASLKASRLSLEEGPRVAAQRLLPDLLPLMSTEDVQEGLQSFLERRPAHFKGR